MLELARPEARTHIRSHPARLSWGIVDGILGLLMLPFGIGFLAIELMVRSISRGFSR